ncbi:MAG: hypothetical protein WC055_02205 [Melioribacteraceae bacterium]
MSKEKLYFENEDDTYCRPLDSFILNANIEGLTEITLFEAVEDKDIKDMIFCSFLGEVGERNECTKRSCSSYEPNKSGRGVCSHRGKLYFHGEKVTIKIPNIQEAVEAIDNTLTRKEGKDGE